MITIKKITIFFIAGLQLCLFSSCGGNTSNGEGAAPQGSSRASPPSADSAGIVPETDSRESAEQEAPYDSTWQEELANQFLDCTQTSSHCFLKKDYHSSVLSLSHQAMPLAEIVLPHQESKLFFKAMHTIDQGKNSKSNPSQKSCGPITCQVNENGVHRCVIPFEYKTGKLLKPFVTACKNLFKNFNDSPGLNFLLWKSQSVRLNYLNLEEFSIQFSEPDAFILFHLFQKEAQYGKVFRTYLRPKPHGAQGAGVQTEQWIKGTETYSYFHVKNQLQCLYQHSDADESNPYSTRYLADFTISLK